MAFDPSAPGAPPHHHRSASSVHPVDRSPRPPPRPQAVHPSGCRARCAAGRRRRANPKSGLRLKW